MIFRQTHEPGRVGLSDFTDMATSASRSRVRGSITGSITSGSPIPVLSMPVSIDWIETDAAGELGGFALYSSGTFEKGGRRHAARRAHGHHRAARVASGEFKQRLSDIADT